MSDVKILIVNPWKKVIGRIIKSDETSYTIKDCHLIEEIPIENGIGLVMIPLIPTNNSIGNVTILKSAVIIEPIDAPDDIQRNFIKTTSGLLLP